MASNSHLANKEALLCYKGILTDFEMQFKSKIKTLGGIATTAAVLTSLLDLSATSNAGDQFYYSINCVSAISLEEPCNVSFLRKSMNVRFMNGRSTQIKYENILRWNYTDSSKAKIDLELASRIGIIGLLFKKAVHRHVFSLSYVDGFGDKQSLIMNFSDTQYVLPVKAALEENSPSNEVK